MAFIPFVETDLPTMANFNDKFQQAIGEAVQTAGKMIFGYYTGTGSNIVSFSLPSTVSKGFLIIYSSSASVVAISPVQNNTTNRLCAGITSMDANQASIVPHTISVSGKNVSIKPPSGYDSALNKSGSRYDYMVIYI